MNGAAERETVIAWSDDDTAEVYTAQRPMVTRLRKVRGAERVEIHRTDHGTWTGETWRVPVGYVQIRPPKRVSDAERERRRVQARVRGFGVGNTAHTATFSGQSDPSSAGRDAAAAGTRP